MKLKLNNLALALSIFAFSFTTASALADDESSPSASPDPKVASVPVEKESKLDNDESVNKSVKSLEDKIREVKLTSTQVSLITEYFGIAPTEAQSMAQLLVYEFGLDFSKEQDLTKDLLDKLSKSKEDLLKEFNKLLDEASVTIEETLAKEPMVQALSSLGQGNYNFISQAPDWIAKETTSVVSNLVKNEEPTAEETTDKEEVNKAKEEEASENPQVDDSQPTVSEGTAGTENETPKADPENKDKLPTVDTEREQADQPNTEVSPKVGGNEKEDKTVPDTQEQKGADQEPQGNQDAQVGDSASGLETGKTSVQNPPVESSSLPETEENEVKKEDPESKDSSGSTDHTSASQTDPTLSSESEPQQKSGPTGDAEPSEVVVQPGADPSSSSVSTSVTSQPEEGASGLNTPKDTEKPSGEVSEQPGEESVSSGSKVEGQPGVTPVQPAGSAELQPSVSGSQSGNQEGQPEKSSEPAAVVPSAATEPVQTQITPVPESTGGTGGTEGPKESDTQPDPKLPAGDGASGGGTGEGDSGGGPSGAASSGGGGSSGSDGAVGTDGGEAVVSAREAEDGKAEGTVVLKAGASNSGDSSNSSVPTEEEKVKALSALKDAIANNELTYLKESQKSTKVLDTFYSLQSSYLDTLESFVAITNSQRLLEKSKNLKQAGLFVDVGVNAVTSDTVKLKSPYLTLGGSYRLDELITVGAYATVSKLSNKFEVGTQRTGNSTTLGVFVAGQKEGVYLALSYARTLNNYNQSLKLNDSLTNLNGYSLTSIKGQKPSIDTFGFLLSYDYKVNEQLTLTPKLSLTQTSYEGKNTAFQLVNEQEETKDLAKIQYDPTSVLDTTLGLDVTYNASKEFSVTGGLRVGYLVQDGANTTKMDRKYDFNTLGVAVEQLGSFTYGAKLSAKYKVNANHSFNLDLNYSRVEKFKVNNLSAKLGYAFTF